MLLNAEYMGSQFSYDLIILDLGLPDKNGLEVLKSWRAKNNKTPVIILTARNAWFEKVDGFKAGADDYLGKPFHFEELLARVNALLRRSKQMDSEKIKVSGLELDLARQSLVMNQEEFSLSDIEFRLLRYFMLNPGIILSKLRLEEQLYELDSEKNSNVIEVYINKLRSKIGKEKIQTKRNQGYIFQ